MYYAAWGGGLCDEGGHEEFGEGGAVVDCAAGLCSLRSIIKSKEEIKVWTYEIWLKSKDIPIRHNVVEWLSI